MYNGIITALATPFKKGRVDYKSLKKLVRFQIENGISGLVINGTTAESPTLTADEVEKIFKKVKDWVDGEVPLILGAGDNSTARTIEKVKKWGKWKPDAFLLVAPYYNKPPQEGMYQHFKAAAKASKKPILLYNVPGRTVVTMKLLTIQKLAKEKNIIGIKEASGDVEFLKTMKKELPAKFGLLSGDDVSAIDFCAHGGQGVISVISHIIPKQMSEICKAATSGDATAAQDWNTNYGDLNKALCLDTNPIPVKQALKYMGIIESAEMRLPLVEMSSDNKKLLKKQLQESGLI